MSQAHEEASGGGLERARRERARDLGERGLELRDFLDDFATANARDPVAIAVVPAIVTWARWRRNFMAPVPPPLSSREIALYVDYRKELAETDPAAPSEFYLAGGALFQADGPNHLRPAEPIMNRLGEITRPSASISRRQLASAAKRGIRTANRLVSAARDSDVWMPADGHWTVYPYCIMAAQGIAYAERLLGVVSPRVVAALAMPNSGPRVLVHAARRHGIPSVYFPHSSVLMDPTFNDLPTDFAGLRGQKEVDYYAEVLGFSDRIEVVGDPSLHSGEMPEHDSTLPPVLAPPTEEEDLRPVIDLVLGAVDGTVLVSPHPHGDLDLLKSLLPDRWQLWDGRTYDLLRKGPPMLMGFTSGVTLEALRLGIPAIELRPPPDTTITYPLIREPHVRIVKTVEELREAVERSRVDVRDPAARRGLRAWAEGWSSPSGEEAARRGADLIERATSRPPPGPIWSVWPDPVPRAGR